MRVMVLEKDTDEANAWIRKAPFDGGAEIDRRQRA